jgi:hypothetical protein
MIYMSSSVNCYIERGRVTLLACFACEVLSISKPRAKHCLHMHASSDSYCHVTVMYNISIQ